MEENKYNIEKKYNTQPLEKDFEQSFDEEIIEPPKRKKTMKWVLAIVILLIFTAFVVQSVSIISNVYTALSSKEVQEKLSEAGSSNSSNEVKKDFGLGENAINNQQQIPAVTTDSVTPGRSEQLIPNIVKKVSPSIVTINNIINKQPDLFQFQGRAGGTGSGIIIKADKKELLIATNYHVVNGHSKLEVVLSDGEKVPAELLGYSSLEDIAVLSVKVKDIKNQKENIVVATLGNSNNIEVGEMAIAIGNPLGEKFSSTVTSGIISALGRSISFNDGATQSNLIQTDAAINPGNSGGALLNLKGEVIGINNGKYVSESVEGIGFAIPINDAKENIESILAKRDGKDTAFATDENRPMLGVTISDIDANINYKTGMTFGVYVNEVMKNSGAMEAGIKKGDIIYGINNTTVKNSKDLFMQMSKFKAGDKVTTDILRDNELITLEVKLYSLKQINEK